MVRPSASRLIDTIAINNMEHKTDHRKILLVEDNPSDIDLTIRAFYRSRIINEIVVADDGQEALDYLAGKGKWEGRDISDLPALILLDLKLPRIPGLELLRHIRADPRVRRIPVVI